jgi:mannose-1-phosphate guanylyltransferase/mannose-6-phosphate isomerase
MSEKDAEGNAVYGDVVLVDSSESLVFSNGPLVAALGADNLTVVATEDAILVADRSRSEDVQKIVARLAQLGRPERETHLTVYRPWGSFRTLALGERFHVKSIVVEPKQQLSLQMHHHRAEHWIVVRGTAKVQRGEEELLLHENQSVYIPLGTRHRLENPGKIPLELIEVQSGAYLGEDDIVRFEDVYGRKPQKA